MAFITIITLMTVLYASDVFSSFIPIVGERNANSGALGLALESSNSVGEIKGEADIAVIDEDDEEQTYLLESGLGTALWRSQEGIHRFGVSIKLDQEFKKTEGRLFVRKFPDLGLGAGYLLDLGWTQLGFGFGYTPGEGTLLGGGVVFPLLEQEARQRLMYRDELKERARKIKSKTKST